MSDKIAIEYLQAAGGDMHGALLRMASTIDNARLRHAEIASGHRNPLAGLTLLDHDLHPNRRARASEPKP